MSEDGRTHKPTPKRIREFRKRGEVATAKELTGAAALGVGLIAGSAMAGASWSALCALTRTAARGEPLGVIAASSRQAFTVATMPTVVGALVGCLVAGALQLGWPPVWRWPKLDPSRWFSFAGATQSLSPKAMLRRLASTTARLAAVGGVVAIVAVRELATVGTGEPTELAGRVGRSVMTIAIAGAATLVAIGAFDYLRARRQLGEKMKMTTTEVKQEHRESEGDPHIKGARRRRMRELARRRAVAATRTADVVVVNPTHYAVALRYRAAEGAAPKVVAKGVDELALRMRETARSAGIPVLERPPLARALHKMVKEGHEIPSPLYHAVAEVLAYVYRLRERRGGRSS
ncbi:MAG TPA: EscU/YscU/HrcU family type III secretion system export apparatus switch protein [Kofleriaceae bacterium]|nr:EscU/YscU/HrcU family type III secretion system export apparatus switch protein [Kofleriaceae bacterium]